MRGRRHPILTDTKVRRMTIFTFRNVRIAALGALLLVAPIFSVPGIAQQATPTPTPSTPPATASTPSPSPTPSPTPTPTSAPTPATPAVPATPPTPAAPATPEPATPTNDSSTGQTLDLIARPTAYMEGKATWEEGFSAITGSFALINGELTKAGLTPAGRPMTVFIETDDTGFKYRAMIPIDKPPEGKTTLSEAIKLGQTPAGKAMRFEHRGSYEDIDATYEAITAYLDERGIEAGNLFIEEYLNDVKTPDDPNLQVDIFVLLK
jgi:effector-binding domain-containing protein